MGEGFGQVSHLTNEGGASLAPPCLATTLLASLAANTTTGFVALLLLCVKAVVLIKTRVRPFALHALKRD